MAGVVDAGTVRIREGEMIDAAGPADDCERLLGGFVSQPANAISSLAFVGAGIAVLLVARRRNASGAASHSLAASLTLTGLGSAAFHGPGGPLAEWAHDSSLLWLLFLVLMVELGRRSAAGGIRPTTAVASAAVAGTLALLPGVAMPTAGITAAAVVFLSLDVRRRRVSRVQANLPAPALLAGGVLIFLLSRTGRPLCAPDTLLQGHAAWHILAAAGIGIHVVRRMAPGSEIAEDPPHRLTGRGSG